jgi:FecR protein
MKKIFILFLLLIFGGFFNHPALAGDVGIGVKFCSVANRVCSDKSGQHDNQIGCEGNYIVTNFFSCENDQCVANFNREDCTRPGPSGSIHGPDYTCGEDPAFGVACVFKSNPDQVKAAPQLKYIPPPDPCAGITAGDSLARFTSLSREVEIRPDCNKDGWDPAKMDSVLHVNDHVRTSEDSSAIIGFEDLSTFLLQPESEIVVTTPPVKDSKLQLLLGNIWVNVKKMAKNGTMEVDMSQAVAGDKGTTFVLSDDGNNSTVKVIEGTVSFTSKADNKTVLVSTGEMVTADKTGVHPKQTFDVAAETKAWDKFRPVSQTSPNNIFIWIGAIIAAAILLVIGYFKFIGKKKTQ